MLVDAVSRFSFFLEERRDMSNDISGDYPYSKS